MRVAVFRLGGGLSSTECRSAEMTPLFLLITNHPNALWWPLLSTSLVVASRAQFTLTLQHLSEAATNTDRTRDTKRLSLCNWHIYPAAKLGCRVNCDCSDCSIDSCSSWFLNNVISEMQRRQEAENDQNEKWVFIIFMKETCLLAQRAGLAVSSGDLVRTLDFMKLWMVLHSHWWKKHQFWGQTAHTLSECSRRFNECC